MTLGRPSRPTVEATWLGVGHGSRKQYTFRSQEIPNASCIDSATRIPKFTFGGSVNGSAANTGVVPSSDFLDDSNKLSLKFIAEVCPSLEGRLFWLNLNKVTGSLGSLTTGKLRREL